jgi:hypothetical protein
MNQIPLALATLLFFGPPVFGSTNVIDLGMGDQLVFQGATNLIIESTPAHSAKEPRGIKITDASKVCEMKVQFSIQPNPQAWVGMTNHTVESSQYLLSQAEEKQIMLKEINQGAMTIVYFELTDKKTLKSKVGEGHYLFTGMGTDHTKYIFGFRMLSDQKDSDAKKQIVQAISAMRFEKIAGAK